MAYKVDICAIENEHILVLGGIIEKKKMRQLSIYGAGHLTKSLVTGLGQIFPDKSLKVYNRTAGKVVELQTYNPRVNRVDNFNDLCSDSSFVFLIVPTSGIYALDIDFVSSILKSDSVIVSCANSVTIDKLTEVFPETKIVRLLPNINWQIKQGTTIFQTNSTVSTQSFRPIRLFQRLT